MSKWRLPICTLIAAIFLGANAMAAEVEKKAVWSTVDVNLYGFIKLDVSYDTARTDVGNFARWVESEELNEDDDQMNITANQTRLGLKFNGPDFGGGKSFGRVEVDFYGGGSENKANLMMRHAYMQLSWPGADFSIIGGQTSDVISPLVPSTLNYTVGWWAGDIGYRRPQLRLTKGFGDNVRLQLEVAATRSIGDANSFSPGDTGEDAGEPAWQGRLSLAVPTVKGKKAVLGVSGHYGREEYDLDLEDTNEEIETNSFNVDLTLPVTKWLTLKGEYFFGENLDAYLGGIGQGIDTVELEEIYSTGGWGAATIGPFSALTFNLGATVDDPDDDDLDVGARTINQSYFGNVVYKVNSAVKVGFEVSYWLTDYKEMDEGDSIRFQSSMIYAF